MEPTKAFQEEVKERIEDNGSNSSLLTAAANFNLESNRAQYSYNFSWMGRPIIQYPQDMIAMQEIIWQVQPELIIETGIAHGGSLIYYASLLELIGAGEVLGIDIEIREHNKVEILKHPMAGRITMFEGSSIDETMITSVHEFARGKERVLVVLDSNHTHEHVLAELRAYAPLVSAGSYCVVFDTVVENLPSGYLPGRKRPWDVGDNPMTAVNLYLKENPDFQVDHSIDNKLLISVAPNGYLKRTK
jgi:cephalosporin hydroxylase